MIVECGNQRRDNPEDGGDFNFLKHLTDEIAKRSELTEGVVFYQEITERARLVQFILGSCR